MKYDLLFQLRGACVVLFLFFYCTVFYGQLPSGFSDVKVQEGYTAPMGVVFSKDGRQMFVWEKGGILWVSNWNDTTYVKQTVPVLDISEEVGNWADFGLLSVALDPNFETNNLIYLYYQVDRHYLKYYGTPQYNSAANDYFSASISRLGRFKVNKINGTLIADLASRKNLLGETVSTGIPLLSESHAGGQIIFGTDGSLLLSTGDNAGFIGIDAGSAPDTYYQQAISDSIIRPTENVGAFRSQMINSFCGKILRLDPSTGSGIPSNPYYDANNPYSAKSCVWALGFRNPYRMTLKTGTGSANMNDANPGTLIVGDVQFGNWEEIDVIEKAGVNCGWPFYEGLELLGGYYDADRINEEEPGGHTFYSLFIQPTAPVVVDEVSERRYWHYPPAIDYSHDRNKTRYPDYSTGDLASKAIGSPGALVEGQPFKGNCITAGTYYVGTAFPTNYQNTFFFADFGVNWIKAANLHDNDTHQIHEIKDFAPEDHGNGIVDLEYCPLDQSIFYVNINVGDIRKISYGAFNRPPIAMASADKFVGNSPLTVSFSSAGSNDPDGHAMRYEWNFGDGSPVSTEANPVHTFTAVGAKGFTVILTVKDTFGLTDTKALIVSLNNSPPSVKITNPANFSTYTLAQATTMTLRATVTDSDTTDMTYAWQVTLRHNNHEHREPVTSERVPSVVISPVGCSGDSYYYLIELTVTDNAKLSAKDSVKIYPDCSTSFLTVKNLVATPLINSVRLNWDNPVVSFDEILVVAKPDTNFLTEPEGLLYVADSSFIGKGTSFDGGKVVYKGSGNAVTVTNLVGGRKYFFRAFTRKSSFWNSGLETSAIPIQVPICDGNGQLYIETWEGLNGSPCYEDIPLDIPPTTAVSTPFNSFEIASNGKDSFGVRARGYICPPESGEFTFYLSGDNSAILYLSDNDNPAFKKTIAFLPDCSYTDYREWTKYPSQKSVKLPLIAGQKYYIEALYKESDGGDHLSVGWQLPTDQTATIDVVPASSIMPYVPPVSTCVGDGKLYVEKWNNIGGSTCISEIPTTATPSTAETLVLKSFDMPRNNGDSFGIRVRGYVCAPESGDYTFYISSDNGGVLYLSTNNDPINKTQIASVTNCGFTSYRQWTKYPEQKSAKITLVAGQKYYIEALFKEGDGGDHLSVGWQLPSNPNGAIEIIPATSLTAFEPQVNICTGDGKLYVEKWENLNGNTCIGSIPLSTTPNFTSVLNLNGFESPAFVGDNYGLRLRGYVCAPVTGDYTFYISSDNAGALWLGTSADIASKRQIAYIPNCDYTNYRQWNKYPEQKSVKITLVAGQKYYIEALFKEVDGGDHLSVGWQTPYNPDGSIEIIPASSLTAYTPNINVDFDPKKCYKITSRLSGKVVEVPNAVFVEGIGIQQNTDTFNLKHKIWRIQTNGDETYRLLNVNTGLVVDVNGGFTTIGTNLIQWNWNADENQRWIFNKNTEGYYSIRAKHSQLAMDIFNNSIADGATLIQNTPSSSLSQQWTVSEAVCPDGAAALKVNNVLTANGYWEGKKAVITWVSNARSTFDYFVVEKYNAEKSAFEPLRMLNAQNKKLNTALQTYSIVDNKTDNGDNLYRVVVYREGFLTPFYSDVITLNAAHLSDFLIFPNPAYDYVDIDVEKVENRMVDIDIMDMTGHILKQKHIERATSTPVRVYLDNIQSGTYMIKIAPQGRRIILKTFIVSK